MITVRLINGVHINVQGNKLDKLMTEIENTMPEIEGQGILCPTDLTLVKFTPFLKYMGIHDFVSWIENDNITLNISASEHLVGLIYISINKNVFPKEKLGNKTLYYTMVDLS